MKEQIIKELSVGSILERREYNFEIITHMLMHGPKPKQEAELRINSIKGIIRYWWRTIQSSDFSSRQLFKAEKTLFGGIEGQRQTKSALRMYLDKSISSKDRVKILPHSTHYKKRKASSPAIGPSREFKLIVDKNKHINYSLDKFDDFIHFLSHVVSFGMRRRRGFGSVHKTDISWKSKKEYKKSLEDSLKKINPSLHIETDISNRSKERTTEFPLLRGVYLGSEVNKPIEALKAINLASSRVKSACQNKNVLGSFDYRSSSPLIATIRKIGNKYIPVILDIRCEAAGDIPDFYKAREIFLNVVNENGT